MGRRSTQRQRAAPTLSTAASDTSTWGKRLEIRCGINSPGTILPPFAPFSQSPDIGLVQRLVDVRAPTAAPSLTSRDVTAYIIATQTYTNNKRIRTRGSVIGVAGTFPTLFVGGETLTFNVDGVAVAVVFAVGDQTAAQVAAAIDAAIAATPNAAGSSADDGGEVRISGTKTDNGNVTITGGTALAVLGFTVGQSGSTNDQLGTFGFDREPAFEALFGRLTTSRGGVSSVEEFTIPAHGASLHIGSDTARLEVFFDPVRLGIVGLGALAAGFSVVGGVASSGFYQDEIRQFFRIGGPVQTFKVPEFSRRLQFFSSSPQAFSFTWINSFGFNVVNVPNSAIPYVDKPQPIPVNAVQLRVQTAVTGIQESPILVWSRAS